MDADVVGNVRRVPAVKHLVYLAGPYSKPDPVLNMHEAIKVADRVLEFAVPVIPHLTGIWHMVSPKPYDEWLEIDLQLMSRCDLVYRFGGESSGADAEVAKAHEWGITVVFSLAEARALIQAMEAL